VAVVVTCDPGPWLEQALESLVAQDYPNLSVLVIDSASEQDPTSRVATVMPGAFVARLDTRVGFGRAANEVVKLVEGASHLLFCHDDVALAPDAVRALVEEAFRSNAGIATPKYLQWDHPDRLLAVGATTDTVGVVQGLVDPGELDQEQHDAVREVLVAPGGATLIRADLFRAIGGFNAAIDQFGEDLDISWRARLAGARVVVVPAARALHLEAIRRGERPGWRTAASQQRAARLADEHRVRTMLTCYRWFDLVWIVPLAVLYLLGEAATRLLQGRPGDAVHTVGSGAAGLRRPAQLWRSRRRVQRRRRASDRDIRRLQIRGNARLRAYLRARVEDARDGLPPAPVAAVAHTSARVLATSPRAATAVATAGAPGAPAAAVTSPSWAGLGWRDRLLADEAVAGGRASADGREARPAPGTDWRFSVVVFGVLAVVLVFGSRSLLGHEVPAVAQLPNLSGGWSSLWRSWWSTWQPAGLGVTAASAPALALLGVAGTVLFGAVGTLQHVVILGPLIIGPLGAYRAARWWGSRRGRLAALIAYAVVPLPYNALARGHWPGLVAYAAAPWVLAAIGRLSGEVPFPVTQPGRTGGRVIGLGLLVAVTGAAVPSFLFVVPFVGLALLGGSALVGRPRQGVRMLITAVGATVVAVVLLLPWSAGVLGSREATLGASSGPAARVGFGQALRFDTGPVGHGLLGWALLVVAALPLVIGRGWRLAWAARLWAVAITFFWLTWAGLRGWIPALPAEVGLAPAAAALAGSAALGAVSFELDLPGYRFGWRQLAAATAGLALAISAIPVLIASAHGRWDLPSADASSVLAFLPDSHAGDYRVLWVGSPDALPLASRPLDPGIGYATVSDGEPAVADLWITGRQGASPALAADLRLVQDRLTTKLGHLLAPMAVQFVVVPNHSAPAGSGGVAVATPGDLLAGLQLQTDLQVVNADANYTVYQNAAWAPARAVLPAAAIPVAAAGAAGRRQLQQTDLRGATPVLTGGRPPRAGEVVPAGSTVYVSATRQSGWRLHVGPTSVRPQAAFGWAMSFPVPAGVSGPVTVDLGPSWALRAGQIAEVVLWLAAIGVAAIDLRRRRASHPPIETVRPEWFAATVPAVARSNWRRGAPAALGAEDLQGDEVWIDV
jgi:GT2 family glycosyltransferase